MTKARLIVLLFLILGAGSYWLRTVILQREEAAAKQRIQEGMARRREAAEKLAPLPGDTILANYAQAGTRPEDDLSSIAHVFANLTLLIKSDAPFRMGANAEFAAALRGKNRSQLRFISDTHPVFNDLGELVDRWETPLYLHAIAHDRIDIRSAGPDRTLWTEDDIHRHYDGSFLKGEALNPPSLYMQPSKTARP